MKVASNKRAIGAFLLTALFYLSGAVLYGLYVNAQGQEKMIEEVDHRLLITAKSLKYMLAPDFHDRAVDKDAISPEEERINRERFSQFARETRFEYLYTLVLKDGEFYFSAPTVTEEELKTREHWYFYPYPDAPAAFHDAIEKMEVKYVDYEDQWGTFRSAALPQVSPSGNRYLACADYDMSYLKGLFWQNLFQSTLTVMPLLLLTLPFIFVFRSQNRTYTAELQEINRELTDRADALSRANARLNGEISERQKAEESLRAGENRIRQILEMVPAGIVIIDPENHVIVDANPAAIKIMEREKESVIGSACQSWICPAAEGSCPITDLGQNVDNSERVVLTASGKEKPVIKTVASISLEGRTHLIESFIDISSIKEVEAENAALQKQLHQSQKMEAIGTLAGGVAHDFNNILSIIVGYAEILLYQFPPDHKHRGMLSEICDAAIRGAEVVRQLLAFGRKQVLETRNIDVNHTVRAFEKMLRRFIGEDIELDLRLMREAGKVDADTSQLEQVLMNLAVNARDAMPDGGRVTIETALVDLDEDYAAMKPGVLPGSYVMVAFSDTGSGIDPDHLKNIFEPFFTTKEVGKGTGLGLSTVYGIVKQHGGNIWVYSEPGLGATFSIYLPYRPEVRVEKAAPSESPPPIDFGRRTILVVEDDPSLRKLLCRALGEEGHTILESSNPEHAIRTAEATSTPIDLLITDVIMPAMKGPEVYRNVHAFHKETRVLYMSGYSGGVITRHGILKEGISFLQKPFPRKTLFKKIAEALQAPADVPPENSVKKSGDEKALQMIPSGDSFDVQTTRHQGDEIDGRHQTAKAPLNSESRYRELADAAPMAIIVIDLKTSQVRYANHRATFLFEVPPEEEEKIKAMDYNQVTVLNYYVDPRDRERFARRLMENGYTNDFVVQLKKHSGRVFWASISAHISLFENRPAIHSVYLDVTQQKNLEENLLKSEAQYRFLSENMLDVVWTLDTANRFACVSPSVEKLRGYLPEEALGQSLAEAFAPDSLLVFQKSLADIMRRMEQGADHRRVEPETFELEQTCRDGATVWTETQLKPLFDGEGAFSGFLGVSRDIGKRRRVQMERERLIAELLETLRTVRQLEGILPICSFCKKIRDENDSWHTIEDYISGHSDARFSHGLCPSCAIKHYANYLPDREKPRPG